MKLLILTQYYPPEIGAPQNRLHELAVRLNASGMEVEVLTAMPNYPKMEVFPEYRRGSIREETIDGIKVYRSGIFVSKSSGIPARLLNYFSFVFTSWLRGRKLGNYDFLLVESPPLFLGISAIALSRRLNAKLIFNVSDLWPESALKLGIVTNRVLLWFAWKLEALCYRKASLITGQTMGIIDNIRDRFGYKNLFWLPNGVDLNYYHPEKYDISGFRERNTFAPTDCLFFYGGIIGHAQGLETVLRAAKLVSDEPGIAIILQGSGPEKEKLLALKRSLNLTNVHFLDPVPKTDMPLVLKEVDVALVPLRKLELFEGAIPSKLFEALAMEKPLLLGVEGEAKRHFIDKAGAGMSFEPENEKDLADKLRLFAQNRQWIREMGMKGRKYVSLHFNRDIIAHDFTEIMQKLGKKTR
jgi:glycosyltransferase involved in cell wall biosynthesis